MGFENEGYFAVCVPSMDTNDLFLRIGWCPYKVIVTDLSDGQDNVWCLPMGNDASISRVAAGDRTVNTGAGIKLVQFTDDPMDLSADPTVIEPDQFFLANGIQLTSDAALLGDDHLVLIEAWKSPCTPWPLKAVHDGTTSSNTYFEDASIDFAEAGVSTGFVIYNQTNGDYCYVGEVQKPSGKKKYCRLTSVDANGAATTAADFDTSDVVYVMPKSLFMYPKSDIGAMT